VATVTQRTDGRKRPPDHARPTRAPRNKTLRALGTSAVDTRVIDSGDGTEGPTCADHVYRLLIEGAAEGALLIAAHGTVLWANPRICEILGREQLIGTSFPTLLEQASLVTFQQLAEWAAPSASPVALTLIAGDGRRVPVRVSASRVPIDGQAGTGLLVTDLTVETAAEAAVTLQARLLDATADAMVARDPEGRITYVNAAAERLYGWRRDDVVGRRWT
jgi:PAS domain S-box-containing protein